MYLWDKSGNLKQGNRRRVTYSAGKSHRSTYKSKSLMKRERSKASRLKLKSKLFNKIFFYFHSNSKEMRVYIEKVLENSGVIIQKLENFKKRGKKIYTVVEDGDKKSREFLSSLKQKIKIQPISPRWVDFCLKRKLLIDDPNSGEFLHLLPFNLQTPCPELKKIQISILNFSIEKTSSLKETARILGFSLSDSTKSADIVLVPKQFYKKIKKEKLNLDYSHAVKKESWLLNILSSGIIKHPILPEKRTHSKSRKTKKN